MNICEANNIALTSESVMSVGLLRLIGLVSGLIWPRFYFDASLKKGCYDYPLSKHYFNIKGPYGLKYSN